MQRTPKDLPQEIRNQLARIASRPTGADQAALLQRDDNSNTQFAILGLWVSRRHGLPVDAALGRTERYFRRTQNADAGWGYLPGQGPGPGLGTTSTPPMTCAGLLGLALGYGATGEAVLRTATTKAAGNVPAKGSGRNPENDRAVKAGLALLATAVGVPTGKKFGPRLPLGLRPEVLDPVPRGTLDYYFLWSLERVAVIYDLKTLGKKDWYAWGAELLLEHQDAAGSWTGRYAQGGVDTCFALLFLRRANPASDLTNALRGRLREAGDVQLRAGGFNQDKTKPTSSATGTAASTSPDGANLTKPTVSQPEVKPVALPTTPPAGPGDRTPERRQLTESLVSATAARQPAVLTALVESKGAVYTDALAAAIPKLTGEAKQKARDGLAKRLARMTVPTLRDKFKDTDVEVRRAAALAVELKGERRLIPDLIGLLDDTERPVSRAAQAALKEMTRQDFGPPAQAAPAERAQAVARWKAWWATQKPD
jgi:hypothetical protein